MIIHKIVLHPRINETRSSIVSSQMDSMVAVTSKIESEMTQVWRQIGVMYQQLSANKELLDKLTVRK